MNKKHVQISDIGQIYASCAFTLYNGNTSCPKFYYPSLLHVTLFYHVKCLTWIAHNFNTCNTAAEAHKILKKDTKSPKLKLQLF